MKELGVVELQRIVESAAGRPVLVATDFDGTLTPIVSNPAWAKIPDSTMEILRQLAGSGRAILAVLSGRSMQDLAPRVDLPAVLSGNHGLEIQGEGLRFRHALAAERAGLVAEAARLAEAAVVQWSGAWIEQKGLTATVHFREVPHAQQYNVAMAVRRALSPFGASLGMRAGKCSLELHPRVGWDKGSAVGYIRRELGVEDTPVLCLGDDRTDETMFRALPEHVTVSVGQCVRTGAAYHVPDAHAVGHVLRLLHELLTGTPPGSVVTASA